MTPATQREQATTTFHDFETKLSLWLNRASSARTALLSDTLPMPNKMTSGLHES